MFNTIDGVGKVQICGSNVFLPDTEVVFSDARCKAGFSVRKFKSLSRKQAEAIWGFNKKSKFIGVLIKGN